MRSKGSLIVVSSLFLISCLAFIWGCGSVSKNGGGGAVPPSGITRLYLAGKNNYIRVFNVETRTNEASIYLPLNYTFVNGVAVSPDKKTLYALAVPTWNYADPNDGGATPYHGNWLLYAIDLATRDTSFTYIIESETNYTWLGSYLAVTPDGSRVITTSKMKSAVFSFTTMPLSFEAYAPTGGGAPSYASGLTISPDGRFAYVGNWEFGGPSHSQIYKYDISANTIVGTVELPNGYGVGMPRFNPAGDKLYVPSPYDTPGAAGKVFIIDLAPDFTIEASSIDVGSYPWGIGFSADGKRAYVANMTDNNIYVITAETGALSKVLSDEALSNPCNVVMDYARDRAYVNGRTGNYITIIDTVIDSIEAQVPILSDSDQMSAASSLKEVEHPAIPPMAF